MDTGHRTRSTTSLLWLVCILIVQMRTVSSSGVLEFQLVSFENVQGIDVKGRCCMQPDVGHLLNTDNNTRRCARSCRLLLRVCLKEYQSEVKPEPPCTYGSRMISVQQFGNSIDFPTLKSSVSPIMRFPVTFNWPGLLSVIVEAWHNVSGPTNKSHFEAGDGMASPMTAASGTQEHVTYKQLMFQYAEGQVLPAQKTWTDVYKQDVHSTVQFKIRVRCDPHYYGPKCEVYCRPRDGKGQAHFTCSEAGAKICMEGWTGPDCMQAICKAGCHPVHGSCQQPGECICALGYIGENCDTCQRYPSCQHGTCEKPFDCTCNTGWGGKFCNQDLNYCTHHKPCLNGGTCTNTGAGSYTCSCSPEFTGTNCETRIESCALNPCLNGGKCSESTTNYTCVCPDGFSGRHCQISAKTCSESPCQNGATCTDVPQGAYLCICNPGWEGSNCDIERDECQSSPCLHGGSCVTVFGGFQCVCPVGYSGFRCEKDVNDCSEHSCLNGGTCEDEVNSFRCHCPPGYIGTLCQINVNDCLTRPCTNGGTCFDLVNDFRCMCRPGFKGKDCSIDINECESSPCRNGGSCEDLMDDYLCHCPPCYTGKQCTIRTDDCLWEATFRPYVFSYNVTMPPVQRPPPFYDVSVGGHSSKQEAGERVSSLSSSDIPLLVGMPLVGVFVLFVLILLVVLFYLYRRTRSHVAAQQHLYVDEVDVYKRENEWNERRCGGSSSSFISNFGSRLSNTMKMNNGRQGVTMKANKLNLNLSALSDAAQYPKTVMTATDEMDCSRGDSGATCGKAARTVSNATPSSTVIDSNPNLLISANLNLYNLATVSKLNYDDVALRNREQKQKSFDPDNVYTYEPDVGLELEPEEKQEATTATTNCGPVFKSRLKAASLSATDQLDDDVCKIRLSDCVVSAESDGEQQDSGADVSGLTSPVSELEPGDDEDGAALTVGDPLPPTVGASANVRTVTMDQVHRYDPSQNLSANQHQEHCCLPCRTGSPAWTKEQRNVRQV